MAEPMDITKFKFGEIINESPHLKTMTIKGEYEGKTCIIRLEKTKFADEDVRKALSQSDTKLEREFINDIYQYYTFRPKELFNDVKGVVITGPSESIIAKHTRSESIFFTETAEIYKLVVSPFIDKLKEEEKGRNNWVFNILDGISERDRLLVADDDPESGFMLISDLKWSGDANDLHAVALSRRRDIRCMRELGRRELPLLENILNKGTKAIKEKFTNMKYPLRVYIHYQPTFYHFHVHFRAQNPEDYVTNDRDNPIEIVIANIRLFEDYYQRATLYYPLAVNSKLYKSLQSSNISMGHSGDDAGGII